MDGRSLAAFHWKCPPAVQRQEELLRREWIEKTKDGWFKNTIMISGEYNRERIKKTKDGWFKNTIIILGEYNRERIKKTKDG